MGCLCQLAMVPVLTQTPVAEGRYKRQRVTNGFSSSTGGSPMPGAAIPTHPLAGVVSARYALVTPHALVCAAAEGAFGFAYGCNNLCACCTTYRCWS